MKYCLTWLLALLPFSIPANGENLSYETLAADPWTDHVRSFRELFVMEDVHTFLEFGLGRGTKFFLDNCDQVTSVELCTESRRSDIEPWYQKSRELFRHYSNWNASIHFFSNTFDLADQRAHEQFDPETFDSTYLTEINALCDQLFQNQHFDVAFVDPGTHIRGDIVNALFNRVDIIAAHDTACTLHRMFGYYKIKCPDNYVKLVSNYGSGITFWIKKDKKDLIETLKRRLP
jgi:hypothetical protein